MNDTTTPVGMMPAPKPGTPEFDRMIAGDFSDPRPEPESDTPEETKFSER